MTPTKKIGANWKSKLYYHPISKVQKSKLQYMKNTFHVVHFYMNEVLLTTNSCKQVHVIKSRGALGTGLTLHQYYFRAGGKPSTSFPPVGLVELYI